MAKRRTKQSSFTVRELDLEEAQRAFNKKRQRGSKYDAIIDMAEKLDKGKALIAEGLTSSEVTGLRKRVADNYGRDWTVSATEVDKIKKLYDVLVHR